MLENQIPGAECHAHTQGERAGTSGAVVAGNRYGLPDAIKAPVGAGNLWRAFAEAMRKAKAAAAVA